MNEFRNMKEHGGGITWQHWWPFILNQKLPMMKREFGGVLCLSLVQLMKYSPVLAGFVPDLTGRSIVLYRIAERCLMLFQTKYHVSLSSVKIQRLWPISVRIRVSIVQEPQWCSVQCGLCHSCLRMALFEQSPVKLHIFSRAADLSLSNCLGCLKYTRKDLLILKYTFAVMLQLCSFWLSRGCFGQSGSVLLKQRLEHQQCV